MMTVFTIMITPEASPSFLSLEAYKTRDAAENAVKELCLKPQLLADGLWQDTDYTYYSIQTVEVKP